MYLKGIIRDIIRGGKYMFNEILEKYNDFRKAKVPFDIWSKIISMLLGCLLAFIANYIDSQNVKIGIAIVGIVFILVPSIGFWISGKREKKENKKVNIDTYKERKASFETFLRDNGFDTPEKREWLKNICLEQLNEGEKVGNIIMPFVTAIVVPTILIIVEIVLKKSMVFDINTVVILFIIMFVYYICIRLIDSELQTYINRNYHIAKRLKKEFDNLAFFELNKNSEESITTCEQINTEVQK